MFFYKFVTLKLVPELFPYLCLPKLLNLVLLTTKMIHLITEKKYLIYIYIYIYIYISLNINFIFLFPSSFI